MTIIFAISEFWLKSLCIARYENLPPRPLVLPACSDNSNKMIEPIPLINVALKSGMDMCFEAGNFESAFYLIRYHSVPIAELGLAMGASGKIRASDAKKYGINLDNLKIQQTKSAEKETIELVNHGKVVWREIQILSNPRSYKEPMIRAVVTTKNEQYINKSLEVVDSISPKYLCNMSCSFDGLCCGIERLYAFLRL